MKAPSRDVSEASYQEDENEINGYKSLVKHHTIVENVTKNKIRNCGTNQNSCYQLQHDSFVTSLDLSSNFLGDELGDALATLLQHNTSLTSQSE